MSDPKQSQNIFLARRFCRYILPADLEFVSLVAPLNTETIRIRLTRGHGTTVDIPLSAETLAALAHVLSPFRGVEPSALANEIADLRQKGLQVLKE